MVAVRNIPVISAMMLSIADQALAAPVAGAVVLMSETEAAVPAIEARGIDERSPKNGQWRGLLHHAVNVVGGHVANKKGRRDLEVDDLIERELEALDEREVDELEERDLAERSPKNGQWRGLLHHAVNVAGGHMANKKGRHDLEYLDERDLDQLLDERGLDARSPKNGAWRGLAHHAIKVVGGSVARHKGRRDLEFLDERDAEDLEERDLDERSPKNGQWRGLLHHAVKVVGGHMANKGRRDVEAEELLVRALESLDERGLDERSPKNGQWRKLAHHAINVVGGHMARKGRRDLEMEDLVARELESLNERDLDERSPKNGQWRKLAHHAINVVGGSLARNKGRRDLGMEDLVARELQVLDERDLEYIYSRYIQDMENSQE
ncbi:unnamed protein product [Clonostachys rhizophaga]|uniref:Uncharacterized protein n=1 Tax=Clonostachys rhizophaga TaxID=160324 RepID=A0A9N9VH35_9HYPO|nr:unnamed protein product [Clonostachys rhizophaga]